MNRSLIFFLCLILAGVVGCAGRRADVRSPRQDTELARRENSAAYELIRQSKFDDAETHLKKAVTADVMFGPAHNNLGLVFFHQDKLYQAAWEFQNAIKLMPYQPEPRNNLGLVFEKAGKLASAVETYTKAREMEPDNPEYLGNLARAKIRAGERNEETKKLLEELVVKDDRPDWRGWAKLNLYRMRTPPEVSPTTQPAQ